MTFPASYDDFVKQWHESGRSRLQQYADRHHSFVPGLLPEQAVNLAGGTVLETLAKRLGVGVLQTALSPYGTVVGPVASHTSGDWLQQSNMVGINVRTIQSFWNVVKYAMTLPASQSGIHLLPIWEPGVVSSLYGMASWQINPEFFSKELYHLVPQLNTVEKQLKAVVNLLHAMGKSVGMDVIPHTDRYSEMVLAQPQFFEWLQRKDSLIVDHRANLHKAVQASILSWLTKNGSAQFGHTFPKDEKAFFEGDFSEAERLRTLFGPPEAYQQRLDRRAGLVDWLYHQGYETVPATMAPPYRGLEVDPDPAARVIDFAGREWRDYRISKPEKMSRVFGPLTRYKFYDRLDDNRHWEIDFSNPRIAVWDYFCSGYASVRKQYNFDFMRGDMSHVQMRAAGVPEKPDRYYDPLGGVKQYINQEVPYFGYFAESFLAPPDVMAYGDEIDHLEASLADTTLGDLQSTVVGSPLFMTEFQRYLAIAEARKVVPNFTMMTGDKDDPRFDQFYLHGNAARFFIGIFLPALPSYYGLGFCQRDLHPSPAPNEHYTKLYVFHLAEGPKATKGPYQWGKNASLFQELLRIRLLSEEVYPAIADTSTKWLLLPDPTAEHQVIAWTQQDNLRYVFLVNLSAEASPEILSFPELSNIDKLSGKFSSHHLDFSERMKKIDHQTWEISALQAGECRCYKWE